MPLSKEYKLLLHCIEKGDVKRFIEVLTTFSAADRLLILSEQNEGGETVLHDAVDSGKLGVVQHIVSSLPTADLDKLFMIQDNTCTTALHDAADKEHTDIMKCILDSLPSTNLCNLLRLQDKYGHTPIHYAVEGGRAGVVNCISATLSAPDFCRALEVQNTTHGNTALHFALSFGQTEIAKCMVSSIPAEELHRLLMIRDTKHGYTAAHCAAEDGHTETLRCMLAQLSPEQCLELLNTKNNTGETPLDIAQEEEKPETVTCIKEFIERATVDARDGRPSGASQQEEMADSISKRATGTVHVETGIDCSQQDASASSLNRKVATSSVDALADILQDLEVCELLGSGGQAAVYKGIWLSTPVAVKMVAKSVRVDLSRTFLEGVEEYQAIRLLRHPNVVQFFGVAQIESNVGLVMELCDTDLLSLSRQSSPKPQQKDLLKILKDSVCGLIYLHKKELIHLDIKPHNILVQHDCGKLADFGLSNLTEDLKDMAHSRSPWSGTPLYRAPELLHRAAPSKAADMWSMGVTALQVMTGEVPYTEVVKHKGTLVPKDIIENRLPRTLQKVGPNQILYKAVLNFDPQKRETSTEWNTSLDHYII